MTWIANANIPTVGPGTVALLELHGIWNIRGILDAGHSKLSSIPGIGPKTAALLVQWAASEDSKHKSEAHAESKLKKVLAKYLGIEERSIRSESTFLGDLGVDSLDIVELTMAIEDEFEVEISDEDIGASLLQEGMPVLGDGLAVVRTVRDAARVIAALKAR